MRRSYVDQQLTGLGSRDRPLCLEDLSLERCVFRDCHLWSLTDPFQRACVRRVHLSRCEIFGEGSSIRGVIVEDCTVEDLKTGGLLHLDGCVFQHVVVRGAVGRVMLTNSPVDIWTPKETIEAFVEENARYYAHVDWALDISEAMVTELDIRGIPGRLIRRNPETQVLVRREKLLDGRWERLELDGIVRFWLSYLIRMGWEDGIFVVPSRGARRRDQMESVLTLRRQGIADPD